MKGYRLDNKNWYDKKRDLVKCLCCGNWYESINTMHVKTHGYENLSDYKKDYDILPKTPCRNKRLLNRHKEHAEKLRKEKKFKCFKKGETSIPKRYLKCSKTEYSRHKEMRKLISKGNKGKKRSTEHVEAMRQRILDDPEQRYRMVKLGYAFKKGHEPKIKGKTWDEFYGKIHSHKMKESLSERKKREWKEGKYNFRYKEKMPCKCEVCGKITYELPHRTKNKRVCGHICAGRRGGKSKRNK